MTTATAPAPLEKAEAERELVQFERAERVLSKLRWLGMASWAWMLTRREFPVSPVWAYTVFAGSVLYTGAVYVLIRRTRLLRVMAAATTICDSMIVTLMCLATGGIHSDFYPYFYVTVLAGSVRFGPRETFFALVLNTDCSTIVYLAAPGPSFPPGDLLLEVYYMLFIALMSSWLSGLVIDHYRRALKQGDRAGLLLAVNREITSTLDLAELLVRILREAARVLPCRGAAILLLDRRRETVERVLVTERFARPADDTIEQSLRGGMLKEAREKNVRIWNDADELGERRTAEPLRDLAGCRNAAVITIRRRDTLGFLLMVDKAGSEGFTDEDRDLLSTVADQAAVAIENARLVEDVLESHDRGQALLWRSIHAEEEERKRVAGEIHDRMGARFFEFYFSLRRCQELLGDRDPAAAEVLARLAGEAQVFSDEIRNLMNELRPTVLDDFGFTEALREYVASLQGQGGLEVSLKIDEAAKPKRPEVNVMLFRVLQEAVLNVRKHAAAHHLAVEFVATSGRVSLAVRDDGRGFDPQTLARGHYGLLHMKERAEACGGRLSIRSRPSEGTEVRVTVADGDAA
jgi:signal transduction histidine kinase